MRTCSAFWFKQASARVWLALHDLCGSCVQSWFFPLRTRAGLPTYATDVAEVCTTGASVHGQYTGAIIGLRESNVM